jgi:hypothetical protein
MSSCERKKTHGVSQSHKLFRILRFATLIYSPVFRPFRLLHLPIDGVLLSSRALIRRHRCMPSGFCCAHTGPPEGSRRAVRFHNLPTPLQALTPCKRPPDDLESGINRDPSSLEAADRSCRRRHIVLALVSANCFSRLRPNDPIDGTVIVPNASKSALHLHNYVSIAIS